MLENGWGRIVNVSSAIAANPQAMIRGNIYATTKTALEAHTLNLAAELAGTGIGERLQTRFGRYRHASLDPRATAGSDRYCSA